MAAAAGAHEASSSMPRCTYDAFLSFRGEDTRKNFTSHLYGALKKAGIHTFLDDDGIERGENIMAELQKAIQESKISIIVFSKDYASSRWCLNELLMIMERKRTVGHIVVPVFYDVDPSQVKKQTGSFGEGFARLEKQFKEEMDKVKSWRAALEKVAELGGMVLDNRHEFQFVQNIVQEIGNKLNRKALNVERYLVGLDSRVRDINLWVQDGSNDVGIAMIYGIGGIGKTTIARTVYNLNFDKFEVKSFLENVSTTTKQSNGLVHLQSKLLSDILKGKTSEIYNVDEGLIKIKNVICCKRVLLVLDDVDQFEQLNKIIGKRKWFSLGSKIIITTRHQRLESFDEVCKKFKVNQMDDDESLQLFSWHAFKQGHPTEDYMKSSRKAVHHCGGLPLALKVLGSSLYDREKKIWERALQNLEAIPLALQVGNGEIQNVLKISYDSLQDDCRDLFLNIACFFIGKDKDYTVGILEKRDFCTTFGIQDLIDRCLLTVNEDKKLMMHQLLRDMGREIIRRESKDDLGKRSRLWFNEDAYNVLEEKIGTETVKGLTLDLHRLMENKHGKKIVALETKIFKKMHNLELLQLNYVKLKGDYKDFSKNLRWLCWHGFPLKSIPTNFYLKKLVALDMRYSCLKHVWRGTKFLAELKFLDLSHSHSLLRTPDFSRLPSLERLVFKDCINLVKVDKSITNLERLVSLNLKNCKNLRKIPREMSMLISLEELNLSGCSKLDEFPEDLRKMESLKALYLDETATNRVLSITRDRKRPSLLSPFRTLLSPRKSPRSTSFSLAFVPHSIVRLSLGKCNLSHDDISYGLVSLPSLRHLNLSGNPFYSLPESIKGLTKLKCLEILHCRRLQSLPEFPLSLESFFLGYCPSLERLPCKTLLETCEPLKIFKCEKLVEVKGIFKLEPIKNTDIAVIESLGLSNVESLGSIEVDLRSSTTGKERKFPLQVLHECGISSIFLPGSEVPSCFVIKNTGSLISFRVPPLVGNKIRCLNLCTLYALDRESNGGLDAHYAKINNKTTRTRWTYEPNFFAHRGAEEGDMLWLSHWNFRYGEIICEDEIEVEVVLPPCLQVKMCGICFMYEPEDKGTQTNTEETVLSAFPWFLTLTLTQPRADANFRCHHSFQSVNEFYNLANSYDEYLNEYLEQATCQTCFICEDLSEGDYERRSLREIWHQKQEAIF